MMKQILLTGSSGFLGSIILQELTKFNIESLGRHPTNHIISDISKQVPVIIHSYDIVIHAAGKAHSIPKNQQQKKEFFDVNVTGTANLLKALDNSGIPKSFVFISTVAVYGKETGSLINEETLLQATDAYGESKIEAEKLIQHWCNTNNVVCTILRLPLIAGPNPPGNLKSMINGIKKHYYFNIADGKARKSIVLARDVAKIIPIVSGIGGIYNLTDGYHPSFSELSQAIAQQLKKAKPLNIPLWIAGLMAKVGDLIGSKSPINSNKLSKITSDLTFDDSKAQALLGWKPTPVLKGFKI
jgi:nucleoside-diphosphate-sugar epimerase